MHAEVGPVGGNQCLAQLLQRGIGRVIELPLNQDHSERSAASCSVDGTDAASFGTHADLWFVCHLDLSDHPTRGRFHADKVNASRLAHQAASSVTADEVVRPKHCAVREINVHPRGVLREAHDPMTTEDRHTEFIDPASQDGLEEALPQ